MALSAEEMADRNGNPNSHLHPTPANPGLPRPSPRPQEDGVSNLGVSVGAQNTLADGRKYWPSNFSSLGHWTHLRRVACFQGYQWSRFLFDSYFRLPRTFESGSASTRPLRGATSRLGNKAADRAL